MQIYVVTRSGGLLYDMINAPNDKSDLFRLQSIHFGRKNSTAGFVIYEPKQFYGIDTSTNRTNYFFTQKNFLKAGNCFKFQCTSV